jgi:hypothetical protein
MPKARLDLEENGIPVTYVKYLENQTLSILIKDKMQNWKDLVLIALITL